MFLQLYVDRRIGDWIGTENSVSNKQSVEVIGSVGLISGILKDLMSSRESL